MGNYCCPCFQPRFGHYTPIKDNDNNEIATISLNSINVNPPGQSKEYKEETSSSSSFSNAAAPSTPNNYITNNNIQPEVAVSRSSIEPKPEEQVFDLNSPVFKGMVVHQKFFNKSSYDPKYVWINVNARSLCLSEHLTKERRHKEANIADITGVIAGPPEKYKAIVDENTKEVVPLDPDLCLSIKFVRGGGIDLQFKSQEHRDLWYNIIVQLMAQERDVRSRSSIQNPVSNRDSLSSTASRQ